MAEATLEHFDARHDSADQLDDLERNVFGIFGIPIDSVDLGQTLERIDHAIEDNRTLFVSTPNVNFLVSSWEDRAFRDTLLFSDLCPPDGMPIVWIARLLKLPINVRVAGADIFDALKARRPVPRRARAFFFGGEDKVAETVATNLNVLPAGITCVGTLNPGFVSIDEMSRADVIAKINASRADILAVFLSAKKAQTWLLQNREKLRIPVRVQFGATINFQAQKVRRAPLAVRNIGLEWLWRIKEEPYLWRRYYNDGRQLLALMTGCVLPLAFETLIQAVRPHEQHLETRTYTSHNTGKVVVCLKGDAVGRFTQQGIAAFRAALDQSRPVEIDVSETKSLDQRFFGLFLMVRKLLRGRGQDLTFAEMPASVRRYFSLNRFDYLLSTK